MPQAASASARCASRATSSPQFDDRLRADNKKNWIPAAACIPLASGRTVQNYGNAMPISAYGGVGRPLPEFDFTKDTSLASIVPSPLTSTRKLGGQAAIPDWDLAWETSAPLTVPSPVVSPIKRPKVTDGLIVDVPSVTLFNWSVMYWPLQAPAERLTNTSWLSEPIAAVAVPQLDVTVGLTPVTGLVKLKTIV
jgi:hypothetical protein